ncbi:hypothetical protein RQP54_04755 [Curvibacter sp. APW13]|uniref:hypothetical protein n=1 Tax=Curvibacter sp. APW13 TaxID=3077236 RepID=UPI0028E04F09|nr:hypothetical protein [Curvibacter sp. APW13]MDT8990167.1 hypothetical protein [Curvibacter sp. APW13]
MFLHQDLDDPRRQWLIRALAMGVVGTAAPSAWAQSILGSKPGPLPPGQSIYRLQGEVQVNNQPANQQTPIKPGDTIQTGRNSELIFAVGTHAMIVRSDSRLTLESQPSSSDSAIGGFITAGLRLLTGKLLSVSRNSPMKVTTATATIGIRGTGFYVESEADRSYFCTCYGATEVQATDDPQSKESVTASHHDRPLYIVKDGAAGSNIRNAPFKNHTDLELALIEAIVGRTTPFVFAKDAYSGPRRNY